MNRMLRWILAAVMVVGLAGCASTQPGAPSQQGSGKTAPCGAEKKCCEKSAGEKAACPKTGEKAACPKAAAEKK